jgi:hypothetical protein
VDVPLVVPELGVVPLDVDAPLLHAAASSATAISTPATLSRLAIMNSLTPEPPDTSADIPYTSSSRDRFNAEPAR